LKRSICMRFRPRKSAVAVLALLLFPAAAVGTNQRPAASFSFSPQEPRTGQQVRFVSSSCDPDGRLVRHAWDLDGDGAFDDGDGRVATRSFLSAGATTVGLEVTAASGATARKRRTVTVDTEYALPRPDRDRLMSPYPIVRIAGRLTPTGARVRVLAVRNAPLCARVRVSCRGPSCPAKRASKYVGRRPVRFRRFERRLGAGTVLTVRISKDNLIGKLTRFRIREDREPRRRDLCLRPGQRTGTPCPRD
jgi:PKD domain